MLQDSLNPLVKSLSVALSSSIVTQLLCFLKAGGAVTPLVWALLIAGCGSFLFWFFFNQFGWDAMPMIAISLAIGVLLAVITSL